MTKRTGLMINVVVGVAIALPLMVLPSRGVRADESKRNSLKSEIERLLQDMASELRDVPGDSSTSDLERTISYAGSVYDKARELRDHAEGDSDAKRMADYYPDISRRYQDAARYLREEKNDYRRLDEYPRKCEDATRELASRMRAYTDSHDPRGVEEVPKLFCKIPESPGDSAEGDAYAAQLAQIADRMRDRIKPKWAEIGNDAGTMIGRAEALQRSKEKQVRIDAGKLREIVVKKMASLQNLLDNELNGSNDPEVRAKMEFGKNEHKRIQADSGKCTVSEVTFGSRRVDCIRVDGSTCYVVEIKPNNEDAKSRGRTQIGDGIKEITRALEGKNKKSELTDKLEVFRPCFDEASEKANLKEELRVYEYCPPEGELYKDFVVP